MTKPLFTTKHYKAIAEILNKIKAKQESRGDYDAITWNNALKEFISEFQKDNPSFKASKFSK